jgi:hypothetical protein
VLKEKGFPAVTYDQDTRGITTGKFSADQKNDKDESVHWEGSSTSNDMQGTLTWTKKGGAKLNFNFSASKE